YQPIPPPSEFVPNLPQSLEAACMRALERDPARRWQSAGEMREVLYQHMEATSGGAFRRDELGRYVISHFEQERAEVRARITECRAEAADAAPPRDVAPPRTLQVTPRSQPPSSDVATASPRPNPPSNAPQEPPPPAAAPSSQSTRLRGLVFLLGT